MIDPAGGPPAPAALYGHVERLVCSDHSLFCSGWLLHGSQPIVALELRSALGDQTWPAQYGSARPDVRAARRAAPPWAEHCGFSIVGPAVGPAARDLLLRARLADGSSLDWPLDRRLATAACGRRPPRGWRVLVHLAGKAARYVLDGRWRDLLPAAARIWRERPRAPLASRQRLSTALAAAGELVWVIDHAMGGGANQFRARLVEDLRRQGHAVLLVSFHLPTLTPMVQLHAAQDAAERLALADYDALFDLWRLRPPRRVYINDLVSFDAPLDLLARLAAALQAHAPTELTLYLHDYYALCPSHCLLDADGRYCDLPSDPAVCNACLARHPGEFVRQAGAHDIGRWRGAWAPLVDRADAIVGFAPTPLALFERVHPLARTKFHLRPHSMAHFATAARPRFDPQGAPVLAIVGEIAQHKGAEVVLGLADVIDARAHRLRLVVIGELRHTRARLPACLSVTGRYRPEQLGRLIEQHGVNAALFPSIWPETFSYVVHELLALGLPVAAFELGAQADALARAPGGVLLPLCTGDELLQRLDRAYDAWRAAGSRLSPSAGARSP